MKDVNIKIKSTKQYVTVLNGPFNLSTKEIDVLSCFIDEYLEIKRNDSDDYVFSAKIRKKVSQKLDLSNVNIYLTKFMKKKALKKFSGKYTLNNLLIPPVEGKRKIIFTIEQK